MPMLSTTAPGRSSPRSPPSRYATKRSIQILSTTRGRFSGCTDTNHKIRIPRPRFPWRHAAQAIGLGRRCRTPATSITLCFPHPAALTHDQGARARRATKPPRDWRLSAQRLRRCSGGCRGPTRQLWGRAPCSPRTWELIPITCRAPIREQMKLSIIRLRTKFSETTAALCSRSLAANNRKPRVHAEFRLEAHFVAAIHSRRGATFKQGGCRLGQIMR